MKKGRCRMTKVFHFSVGSVFGVLLILYIYHSRRSLYENTSWMRWLYHKDRWWMLRSPYFIMIFGVWALVPAIFEAIYGHFTKHWFGLENIFFGYGIIEFIEHHGSAGLNALLSRLGLIVCMLIYGGSIISYVIFINRIKKQISHLDKR